MTEKRRRNDGEKAVGRQGKAVGRQGKAVMANARGARRVMAVAGWGLGGRGDRCDDPTRATLVAGRLAPTIFVGQGGLPEDLGTEGGGRDCCAPRLI